jgi:hypothetical protein
MAVSKKHVNCVLEAVEDEGNPVLHVAPSKAQVAGIPPEWAAVLASPDARTQVVDVVWGPVSRRVPKIIQSMKRHLQGVGVLTTDSRPPSLIYFLTLEDKEPDFYRGYLPAKKLPPVAKSLPSEFLDFYKVHDGWVDQFEFLGPMRSTGWHPLSGDARTPSAKFLVVLVASGGALLGFDLRKSPALCYVIPSGDDPPEIVPKIWTRLDKWIATQWEDLLPFSK